ncbi:MAG: hypothetical protein KGI97_07840, partial [Alphaproteobacteria bacterium]|nr:hypothetical protein [Alphaproteobacteria bacterium]
QSAALSSAVQQIGDRQRSLVTSLDAQRDVVSGLLNRLTLAQDETADAADRAVARLESGAQKIASNLDTMETKTGAALANIETAASGFATQAEAIGKSGQQAEEQVRGLVSVTSGMEEQARHLREAMQVETARVIEQLSGVIAQLDTASQKFASTTETGAAAIRQQSDVLAQTAEQSDARIANAGEKMRGHMRLVGEIGDKAEAQARQLADASEFATTRLVALRESLETGDAKGRDLATAAQTRIAEVKQALESELLRLGELAQQATTHVSEASKGLAVQSDALRANLAASESALGESASFVREEATNLPSVINRSVEQMDAAARAIKSHASDADQALVGVADRFISVTSVARNNIIDEMQRVSNVADEAGKALSGFNMIMAEQVASMVQSAAMLSGEQRELADKATKGIDALARASDRLGTLRGEAADTAERLVREFDALDQRAIASGTRLAQTGDIIAKQTDAITEAVTRAETRMGEAGNGFREQLERIRNGLQTQIDDINRGLMQITAQLERTGASLRSTAVGAVADVERVGARFEETGGAASEQIDARTKKMEEATAEVAKMLDGFGAQMDAMLARMAQAGEGIKHREGDALAQLQSMLGHLGTVAEKLEATRRLSGSVSQGAIERLDEVVNAVQAHMNNMAAGAQTAAGIMRGINQIYSDQTQSLSKGVGEAHSQVQTMNKSIDEMQQRADKMRASLKLQGDELMGTLRQILVQLELTGDGLTDAVNRTLQEQAAAELKKIG